MAVRENPPYAVENQAPLVGVTIAEALKPSNKIDMDRVRQITRRVVSEPLVDSRPPKEILDQAWGKLGRS
jgi:hypothetical protein